MRTRIAIVGGFLGSGKTTLLLKSAKNLMLQGYRVGLVTNDQGDDLVDTALAKEQAIPVLEVIGGCFCCRFPDLLAGLQHLYKTINPHIILAEPVGSCTDLIATVMRPLSQFYGNQYELAPLTVLIDSSFKNSEFNSDVNYLYKQQILEAEMLLLNKRDLLNLQTLRKRKSRLQKEFPEIEINSISAKNNEGIDFWLNWILGRRSSNPKSLIIDYDKYAKAEACLGWLNTKGQVYSDKIYSLRYWIEELVTKIGILCDQYDFPIAHIKTFVSSNKESTSNLSKKHIQSKFKASLTNCHDKISWDLQQGEEHKKNHEFILNVRINSNPKNLEQIILEAIENAKPNSNSRYYLKNFECFSPLAPKPNYRL